VGSESSLMTHCVNSVTTQSIAFKYVMVCEHLIFKKCHGKLAIH
jgi:hypothetical protein